MGHIHEKIDFTASVFIVHENKVLLHMHKKLGKWLQPGGHIELDEDPNQAAIREAKEETGLDIVLHGNVCLDELQNDATDIIAPRFLNRHRYNESHEHIDLVYFGRVAGGEEKAEEGSELRWFSVSELYDPTIDLYQNTRAYGRAAIQELA